MDKRTRNDRVGGATVRIGDCHIWAAIQYLDSHSNYCEHLPEHRKPHGNQPKPGRKQPLAVLKIGAAVTVVLYCIILLLARH